MWKILAIVTLVSLLVMAPAGCKKPPAPWESMAVSSIASDPVRVNIPVNETSQLTINAIFSKISYGNITTGSGGLRVVTNNLTFQSSNETIATVNNSGLVRGIAAGTTTIKVTYTGGNETKTTDVAVTITAPPGT